MDSQSQDKQNEKIVENKELNIWEAIIPVIALVGMLAYNVSVFKDDALGGSNQFIFCLLYTSPSPRDQRGSRMPSSA